MTQTETATEKDLLISLTLHNFSAELLKEFAQTIVKPYFVGNLNQAIRSLMEKAIAEEETISQAIVLKSKVESGKFSDGFELASP
jgi:ferritin-like protein